MYQSCTSYDHTITVLGIGSRFSCTPVGIDHNSRSACRYTRVVRDIVVTPKAGRVDIVFIFFSELESIDSNEISTEIFRSSRELSVITSGSVTSKVGRTKRNNLTEVG